MIRITSEKETRRLAAVLSHEICLIQEASEVRPSGRRLCCAEKYEEVLKTAVLSRI